MSENNQGINESSQRVQENMNKPIDFGGSNSLPDREIIHSEEEIQGILRVLEENTFFNLKKFLEGPQDESENFDLDGYLEYL